MKVEDIERFNRQKTDENHSEKNAQKPHLTNDAAEKTEQNRSPKTVNLTVQDIERINQKKRHSSATDASSTNGLHAKKSKPSAVKPANSKTPRYPTTPSSPHAYSALTQTASQKKTYSANEGADIDFPPETNTFKKPSKSKKRFEKFFKRFGLLIFAGIILLPLISKRFSIEIPAVGWFLCILLTIYLMRFYARDWRRNDDEQR